MKVVLDGRATYPSAVLAMGMFDGLHIGHQVLIKKAKSLAEQFGVPLVVCTFEKHPLTLIDKNRVPTRLTSIQERLSLMESLGVDLFFCMPFGQELLDMPPENYIGELVRRFHPMAIVCGYNHHFGSKGAGSPALLHALGHALDFETVIIPKVTMGEEDVSASKARELLSKGEVHKVMQWLKRPYAYEVDFTKGICTEPEKQPLPEGFYRAVAISEGKHIPLVVQIHANGKHEIMGSCKRFETVTMQWISEIDLDTKKQ